MGREVVWIDYEKIGEKARLMIRIWTGVCTVNESLEAYKAVNISHWRIRSKLYDVLIIMSIALRFIYI